MSGFHAAAAPKCTVCDKSVYKMEEVNAIGKIWHKDCFLCGGHNSDGCHKRLTLDSYTDHEGQPYCKSCHGRLFGPRGFSSASASVHSYVDDAGVAPVSNTDTHPASGVDAAAAAAAHGGVGGAVHAHEAAHGTHPAVDHAAHAHAVYTLGGAAAPKCAICAKSVYKMEEVNAIGKIWHKDCFQCGGANGDGCHKKLTLDGYTDHEGQPYCKSCHGRLFGPRGYNNSAGTHSYVGDSGVTDGVAAVALNEHTPTHAASEGHADVHAAVHAHQTKSFGAPATKCTICDKSVFKMEEVVAIGKTWHKDCFLCGGANGDGCRKHLTLDGYAEHAGQPYCKVCHGRLFGPRGYNNAAGTHSYVDDAGVANKPADA